MPAKNNSGSSRLNLIGCRLSESDYVRALDAARKAGQNPSKWCSQVVVDTLNRMERGAEDDAESLG